MMPNPFRALGAAVRASWWKLRGWTLLIEPHEQFSRMNHCDRCAYQKDDQCLRCTCYLFAKTVLASEKCPIGLWGQIRRKKRP